MANRIEVEYQWEPAGELGVLGGYLQFPKVTGGPAIYSFRFASERGVNEYIGEAAALSRRFQQYARPGPSQRTNLRINPVLRLAVERRRGPVDVRIVTVATLRLGMESIAIDLNERWARIPVESRALDQSDADVRLTISEGAARNAKRPQPEHPGAVGPLKS